MIVFAPVLVLALAASGEVEFSPAHRLVFEPVSIQANGKFSQHRGTTLGYTYELRPGVGLTVLGQYNWSANSSGFVEELISKARLMPEVSDQMLMRGGASAGLELSLIAGEILDRRPVRVSVFAGPGLVWTGLTAQGQDNRSLWFDTGVRTMGTLALAVRIELTEGVDFQLSARDNFFVSHLNQINGCDAGDLDALRRAVLHGDALIEASTSRSCRVSSFDPQSAADAASMLGPLDSPVRPYSPSIVHILSLSAGISARF